MSVGRRELPKVLAAFIAAGVLATRSKSVSAEELAAPNTLPTFLRPGRLMIPFPGDFPTAQLLREVEDGPDVTETGLVLDDRTAVALAAAEAAVASMRGAYSWEEYRQCSTFISAYLRGLGLPISDKTEKAAVSSGLFPWSGTLRQVRWLRQNLPKEYIRDEPLIRFLNGELWDEIMPGEVIYLTKAIGHNGYDTYYHVAALVGYHGDGQPQFAELAVGMKNASAERTFEQLTRFYSRKADGAWDVTPSNPRNKLVVTWFDPLAVIRDFT